MHQIRPGKEVLYLSRRHVEEVGLAMSEVIDALEQAFREKGEGRVEMPPKPGLHTNGDAFLHAMPAYVPALGAAGIKWVGGYPENPAKHNLPYITGLYILNDPETGVPLAVMDCIWITAQRTGAASGLSAKYLARPGSRVLAIFGCGVQARTQLEALALTLPELHEVRCYDIRPEHLRRFITEMSGRYPHLSFKAAERAEEAARDADVLVSAGPILKHPEPTLAADWFGEGALGLPIDFDSFWTPGALQRADRYYVDDRGQYAYYKEEQGFFGGAPAVDGDLGELVTGGVPGRQSDSERIIAMNLGLALEDVVTARPIYERALEKGIGQILEL